MDERAPGSRVGTGEREQLLLDGAWQFRLDGHGGWRTATVPGPWQAEFDDLRHASGRATYVREFSVLESWAGRFLVLRFGAVNYLAEVTLNGTLLGRHEGGYLPFEFQLPAGALRADNRLEVRVTLPNGDAAEYPDHPFGEIPHGKQSWYGPLGGIWQSVTLEARAPEHVSHCAIAADPDSGLVELQLELSVPTEDAEVVATVRDPAGNVVAQAQVHASSAAALSLPVEAPALWSPQSPILYQLELQVLAQGRVVDRTRHSFGFRKIEAREGRLFLNGQPLYLRGALDQDYYPEGICTPPSLEFLEDQARKAKELGLNLLRCHIKVPDPRYYDVADRLGLLVWTEIPNVQSFTDKSAQRLRDTMEGILRRDGNHPSIVIWTIINEDWGTRLVESAEHRAWLKDTFDWLKAKDPTRLVVDNSACIPNFHVKSDINDYHYYRSVPERRAEWEKLTDEFAAGADWTYSPNGDAIGSGEEPLVVSEFGVWGLPNPAQVADRTGAEPWWFESGPGWGDGTAYPHGVQGRFATYHLDRAFGSFEDFIAAVQWYQFGNLKYEIESMRARASIMGYVITELTDVHWEANGLLDLNRNPRIFHDRFAEFNTDLVIVARPVRYSGYAGETLDLELRLATGGLAVPEGAKLRWSVANGESGEVDVPAAGPLEAPVLGPIHLPLPRGSGNSMASISFLLEAGGRPLARNSLDIAVYQRLESSAISVAAADKKLADHAAALGYSVVDAADADVILTHALDASDITAMQAGARYLVLADGSVPTHGNLRTDPSPPEPPTMPENEGRPTHLGAETLLPNIGLRPRDGSMWRGDWIASFSWLRREGTFASMPGGPMLDLSFDGVVPRLVMTGFRPWEYEGLVHSGLVVGWVHKPVATIAQRRIGRGGLVATTYRLTEEAPHADPVAAHLMAALVRCAARIGRVERQN